MKKYRITFYSNSNGDWVPICLFNELHFKSLEECEHYLLNILKNNSRDIRNLIKCTIEEIHVK